MHSDITKIISEFEHRGYTVKIVEREMDRKFLYCYVFDSKGNDTCMGNNNAKEEDLNDLNICIPKLKKCIDDDITSREKWAAEKREKKEKMKWTGRKFKRGNFVHYKGSERYNPIDTCVWTHWGHDGMEYYLIEHPQGQDMDNFINKRPFKSFGVGADGFEAVHSSQLQEGLKYLPIYCTEFQGETDELILLKEKL